MVLLAISLMLLLMLLLWELLMVLLGQSPTELRAAEVALSVREDALPLVHEVLSHDIIMELLVLEAPPCMSRGVVDCAWVSAGSAATEVIKAAVAAMVRKGFIWVVLVETERGRLTARTLCRSL